ncbi:uncharacterized protein LOC143469057 [Clavelina lepadiformis]|uniref:uncharacterized protein LOC143469057 n=1 Tax=Clavelina lepadiformis TaxID=159417 RepID=UPI0040412C73
MNVNLTPPPNKLLSVIKAQTMSNCARGVDGREEKLIGLKEKCFYLKSNSDKNRRNDFFVSSPRRMDRDQLQEVLLHRRRTAAEIKLNKRRGAPQLLSLHSTQPARPSSLIVNHTRNHRRTESLERQPHLENIISTPKQSPSVNDMRPHRPGSNLPLVKSNISRRWLMGKIKNSVTPNKSKRLETKVCQANLKDIKKSPSFRSLSKLGQGSLNSSMLNLLQRSQHKQNTERIMKKISEDNSLHPSDLLKKVLQNKDACNAFRNYLEREHSEENIDFWKEVEKYREKTKITLAEKIFNSYVVENAPKEVNITHETKSWTKLQMRNPNFDVFDRAQNEVFVLMQKDSFARFCSSVTQHHRANV